MVRALDEACVAERHSCTCSLQRITLFATLRAQAASITITDRAVTRLHRIHNGIDDGIYIRVHSSFFSFASGMPISANVAGPLAGGAASDFLAAGGAGLAVLEAAGAGLTARAGLIADPPLPLPGEAMGVSVSV